MSLQLRQSWRRVRAEVAAQKPGPEREAADRRHGRRDSITFREPHSAEREREHGVVRNAVGHANFTWMSVI
jgi:hypothetical protein